MPLPRVLSGIQPTAGSFQLGNYLGALRQWVALQETTESFYCVVDLHAITMDWNPEELRQNSLASAAQLLALGVDPAAGGRTQHADRGEHRCKVVRVDGEHLGGAPEMGERIVDAAAALGALSEQVPQQDRVQAAVVAAALVEAMSNERYDERVVVGGTANLARFGDSFDQSIKPMLEALEEHVVLLKLLGEATSSDSITVRIGHEGPYQELASTSVIATPAVSWVREVVSTTGC